MEKQYTIKDFLDILERLRAKDGCPWDQAQTHLSLRPCMMEEAAELIASIRIYEETGNYENMREELGDILLQVAMHSVIAKEEELFTFDDVVDEVAKKMVFRHPHVFSNETIHSSQEQLEKWEELKKKEKEGKKWLTTPLRDIPPELPSLTRAIKMSKKVDHIYHDNKTVSEDLDMLRETLESMKSCYNKNEDGQWEMLVGKMLLVISDLAAKKKIPAEQILNDEIEKIVQKYEPKP